ncbi:MAG: pilus assembly protein TadG-related protein [Candidatus Eiseniibacteriota bacterium]|jgi:Flp pilus assembly protein TadG
MDRNHPARRTRTRQRGSVIITVAFALVACFACSVLVIDLGLIWLTRIQLQNAADAAALAGAFELINGNEVGAREAAIQMAASNVAWREGLDPVVIVDGDVTFPTGKRCRVETHRTTATGDALRTFLVKVVDPGDDALANVTAVAEAEYFYVCETTCMKPWSVPDRWDDLDDDGRYDYEEEWEDLNGNGEYDPGEPYTDANGNGQWDDREPYDPVGTGYLAPDDVGTQVHLKIGDPNDVITPGFFYAVNFPPLNEGTPETGAAQYRWNIENCSPYAISIGDELQIEPGNMTGPTKLGAQALIDQDPQAYWDNTTGSVLGSAYGTSPRVVHMALFDPYSTPQSGRNSVFVSKLCGFFLEDVQPNGTVVGRFMDDAVQGGECDPGQPGLLYSVRLEL